MLRNDFIKQEEKDWYWNKSIKEFYSLLKFTKNSIPVKHINNMPAVRIKSITLINFKNIEYGEIIFNCGREFVPYDTEADIMGIYGQNGSGKSTIINSLSLVHDMLSGIQYGTLSRLLSSYIKADADFATVRTVFDLQYLDGRIRTVEYEFTITANEKEYGKGTKREHGNKYVRIINEKVRMGGDFYRKKQKMQLIIDTSDSVSPFVSAAKQKEFIAKKDNLAKLEEYMKYAYNHAGSFVFLLKALKYYKKKGGYSEFLQVLVELKCFGTYFFKIIDSHYLGAVNVNETFLIITKTALYRFDFTQPNKETEADYNEIDKVVRNIGNIMSQIIPGFALQTKVLHALPREDGKLEYDLIAIRNGIEVPLRYESDGIRRLISVIALYTAAFNEKSRTIVIDEFDAGIFEYLLGELLEIFQESGKGQLIFTSHNLRPLEVLDRKFLCFTTTDPKNRFTQIKDLENEYNLRDAYFREIILNSDDLFYRKTKKYKILQALHDAEL